MKIYFTASARGKKTYGDIYKRIYKYVEKQGHKNLDDLLFKVEVADFYQGDEKDQLGLYKSTIQKIRTADVVVLEVSEQSLSMGFVIEKALEAGKPVVLLYDEMKKNVNPYFLGGIKSDRLQVIGYRGDDLETSLGFALDDAKDQMDVRFNFFVSPKIVNYLDWVAKKKRMPRAVYLRRLIEHDMEKNKEYSSSI